MVIDVHLKNKSKFKNDFNDHELNPNLGDYIFNKALISKLTKKKGLKIRIKSDFEISEIEKETFIDMIRSYYGNLIKTELIYLSINNLKSAVLFLVGIFVLLIAYFLNNFVIHEIFIIIGWLGIWEAIYSFLFANGKHRRKEKLLKKLTECYIEINE